MCISRGGGGGLPPDLKIETPKFYFAKMVITNGPPPPTHPQILGLPPPGSPKIDPMHVYAAQDVTDARSSKSVGVSE